MSTILGPTIVTGANLSTFGPFNCLATKLFLMQQAAVLFLLSFLTGYHSYGQSATTPPAKPAAAKPATTKPTTAKSAATKPDTAKPAATKPAAAKPDTAKPAAAKLAAAKSDTAKPVAPTSSALDPDSVYAAQLEAARKKWNFLLTDSLTRLRALNTAPNALLAETVKDRPPGTALDVGMGEGRNAIFLAQQGWQVVGVDIADKALGLAQKKATAAKVKITTVAEDVDRYYWGSGKWDLIVLSYVGGREYVKKVMQALRPGGIVVLEAFHEDADKERKIGSKMVFGTNELRKLYTEAGLKILRYEEPIAVADFGKQNVRLVKMVAQKP
jgi:2-polyprenyl-3-methyl-5-hydroxy-6-metoxy-1,4-benzoquinol methylase